MFTSGLSSFDIIKTLKQSSFSYPSGTNRTNYLLELTEIQSNFAHNSVFDQEHNGFIWVNVTGWSLLWKKRPLCTITWHTNTYTLHTTQCTRRIHKTFLHHHWNVNEFGGLSVTFCLSFIVNTGDFFVGDKPSICIQNVITIDSFGYISTHTHKKRLEIIKTTQKVETLESTYKVQNWIRWCTFYN